MEIVKEVSERFADFIFDWYYEKYLLLGGYGSGKSYAIVEKIIFKCLQERRKVLVVREVYDTLKESCYDLFKEILEDMNLLAPEEASKKERMSKVVALKAPMELKFPNGSRVIFKGMDKPEKVKSINGVSIVWIEECSEVKYEGYKELLGRIRTKDKSMHFILSCNPVGRDNWVYRHFFVQIDDDGAEHLIQDENELYEKGTIINRKNNVYYHHSLPTDNPFLPQGYIKRLIEMKEYDEPLWRVAYLGRFGANGTRVLPQFKVAKDAAKFVEKVRSIPLPYHFFGFDFGFEESYNAVISMAVDDKEKILYIYDEIYENHVTDPEFAKRDKMLKLKKKQQEWKAAKLPHNVIVADNEDPKAVAYYRSDGYEIKSCINKFAGSRLSNTRKIKRFKKIICSPKCKNTIRELKDLTYKKKQNGDTVYDEFNIDPHTFSAIWYALEKYNVSDIKYEKRNNKKGGTVK